MKAACIVAHPDDCVIFARPFIDNFPKWDWHIYYLTYVQYHPRVVEMANYWRERKIFVTSFDYEDTYLDMENNKISFNEENAERVLKMVAEDSDIVLTHNPDGDYGHIHHKFVSSCVSKVDKPIVYFANWQQQNLELCSRGDLNLDQFPLHREVIEGFQDRNLGRYFVTGSAKELIDV